MSGFLDLMESNEDIKCSTSRNSGLFDYIVIDTDMTMNSITKQAMLNSQKIILYPTVQKFQT